LPARIRPATRSVSLRHPHESRREAPCAAQTLHRGLDFTAEFEMPRMPEKVAEVGDVTAETGNPPWTSERSLRRPETSPRSPENSLRSSSRSCTIG
jgi:hypothetical protein